MAVASAPRRPPRPGARPALTRALLALALAAAVTGCRSQPARDTSPAPAGAPGLTRAPAVLAGEAVARPRIVVLGDSLAAGLGLPTDDSFPAIVQRRIEELGYAYEVVNMGVSGDTSAGGLARLDWALEGDVRVLVLALGANDGLRGLSPSDMAANLGAIIDRARDRGVTVLLCGMEAPPNFGASYTMQFRAAYRQLARDKRVAFVPFLLEGVAGDPALNQADGIHPNATGAQRVADIVWKQLQPILDGQPSP
jgi:acyl-CoA thioesterase-1